MRPPRLSGIASIALLLLLIASWDGMAAGAEAGAHGAAAIEPAPNPIARVCELGITYALSGEDAAAESVFVSLLSRAPNDARALNNLGNLHLWRGDASLALAFYARAGEVDSADAGIILNEATALMIAGEVEPARERAGEGIRRAGSPESAARLLGLRYVGDDDAPRAGDRAQVSRDEVLALLRAASRSVPPDSSRAARAASQGAGPEGRKPIPAWRSAGARGASDTDVTAVVYWKR
jgi:tetratricopeptide (TPR) repeat protein